jgi:hypothetical protein
MDKTLLMEAETELLLDDLRDGRSYPGISWPLATLALSWGRKMAADTKAALRWFEDYFRAHPEASLDAAMKAANHARGDFSFTPELAKLARRRVTEETARVVVPAPAPAPVPSASPRVFAPRPEWSQPKLPAPEPEAPEPPPPEEADEEVELEAVPGTPPPMGDPRRARVNQLLDEDPGKAAGLPQLSRRPRRKLEAPPSVEELTREFLMGLRDAGFVFSRFRLEVDGEGEVSLDYEVRATGTARFKL